MMAFLKSLFTPNKWTVVVHVCNIPFVEIFRTFFYKFLRVHTKRYLLFENTFSTVLEVQIFKYQMQCFPNNVTCFGNFFSVEQRKTLLNRFP